MLSSVRSYVEDVRLSSLPLCMSLQAHHSPRLSIEEMSSMWSMNRAKRNQLKYIDGKCQIGTNGSRSAKNIVFGRNSPTKPTFEAAAHTRRA